MALNAKLLNEKKIIIGESKIKGKGVFAKTKILKDEIIETCPVIPFSEEDAKLIEKTRLADYWYAWKTENNTDEYGAFCLGYGSMYNHSSKPNARIERDFTQETINFIALEDIEPNSEIYFKYGTVWFKEK